MKNLTKRNKILLGLAGLVIVVVVVGVVLLGPSQTGLFGTSNLVITQIPASPWRYESVDRLDVNSTFNCNWKSYNPAVVMLFEPSQEVKWVQGFAAGHGTATVEAHCGPFRLTKVVTTVTVR